MTENTEKTADGGQYTDVSDRSRRQFLKTSLAAGAGAFALGGASLASGAEKVEEICDGEETYEEIEVTEDVALIDNQWGDESAPQCIWLNDDDSFGWDFEGQGGEINYPQLYIGDRPWGKSTDTDPFPTARGDIDELVMEVDADLDISGGEWNLAEEWWLLGGEPSEEPDLQYEVMLVLEANQEHKDAWEFNKPWREVGTDEFGNTIKFWYNNDGGTSAPQLIYWVDGGMTEGKVDLTVVMDDMTEQHNPSDDLIFTGVELGTEYSGTASGSITFNHFGLTVNGNTYTAGSEDSSEETTDEEDTTEEEEDTTDEEEDTTDEEDTTEEEDTTDDSDPDSTELSLAPSSSSIGASDSVDVDLVLEEVPEEGLAGYEIDVSVSDPDVLAFPTGRGDDPASFPSEFSDVNETDGASDGSSVTVKASDTEETIEGGETDLTLATLTLDAQDAGETSLSSSIETLQTDGAGATIEATTPETTISVDSTDGPTWPDDPTDPDDDGLYEDVSGNEKVDFPDVNQLYQNADSAEVEDNVEYYDFDDDGSVDLQDVLALFDMV
ncbi:MAG: twin-arginine translocation signal domain-containing protein [Halococcoides sp.]